ncbi:GNAT family N-acetyltransferase [Aliiroseovarius crassostreae]|uniref:GNAT family N-acetyltransferase n=1 Tax=Aliiroseovarius crassostreae TaxID=154981 RepID=UPI002200F1E0|nr:GNAT family N-acetyltransferase [Aliiroseovarius crassostreae]UWQ11431.1 GNAT family N-acetyltransferase [Aliiroseovarius crassostreae]
MKITPATPDQAPAIANILSQWNAATPWMPRVHSRASEKEFATRLVARGWVSVAQEQGRVLGFLARAQGEIHALYVAPHARGRGIGGALVDHAKQASNRLTLYTFVANEAAQRFYLRKGFHEVARGDGRDNDEALPDIRYEWSKPQ